MSVFRPKKSDVIRWSGSYWTGKRINAAVELKTHFEQMLANNPRGEAKDILDAEQKGFLTKVPSAAIDLTATINLNKELAVRGVIEQGTPMKVRSRISWNMIRTSTAGNNRPSGSLKNTAAHELLSTLGLENTTHYPRRENPFQKTSRILSIKRAAHHSDDQKLRSLDGRIQKEFPLLALEILRDLMADATMDGGVVLPK